VIKSHNFWFEVLNFFGRWLVMKEDKKSGEEKKNSGEEKLTRRAAIRRIASLFAGAAMGAKAIGQQASQDVNFAYLSKAPYNPYADSVAVPSYRDYSRYMSFYSSYSSHKIYVPPPYTSKK
jgi:hypothetical protein